MMKLTSDVKIGIEPPQFAPSPLNLWMNIPVLEDRTSISYDPPVSKKGDFICLKAMRDVVIVFSACPQVRLSGIRGFEFANSACV